MPMLMKTRRKPETGVLSLALDEIVPNPMQPRQIFDGQALEELAESIRQYGVLCPLSVRRCEGGYELVAGERRWRAARLAGLERVPCLVLEAEGADSGLLALVENLQRQDLDYIEQARGMARLIETYGLSQEECARRLGQSQSAPRPGAAAPAGRRPAPEGPGPHHRAAASRARCGQLHRRPSGAS